MDKIDIETASQPFWEEFLNTLSDPQKSALRIWRSGAVWTPTRRY